MPPIQIVLGYTGTGLSWSMRGVAGLYYREISKIWLYHMLITLRRAGLGDPRLRHEHSSRVSDHKHQDGGEPVEVELILWGHSQGAIEVLFQLLRSNLPPGVRIVGVFLLAPPLDGSPAANLAKPLEFVPWPMSQLFTGVLEMRPGSRSLVHLHDKLRSKLDDPDFWHPPLYVIGGEHDHLVPCSSAWNIIADVEYPADKLHFLRTIHGDAEPLHGVEDLQVGWGMDTHIGMPLAPEVHECMARVVGWPHSLLDADLAPAA